MAPCPSLPAHRLLMWSVGFSQALPCPPGSDHPRAPGELLQDESKTLPGRVARGWGWECCCSFTLLGSASQRDLKGRKLTFSFKK